MYEGPKRKPRIQLKVDAEEAYLLIPRHAEDPYLIVGDIGRFTVRNQFKFDGEEGTFTHRHKEEKTECDEAPSPVAPKVPHSLIPTAGISTTFSQNTSGSESKVPTSVEGTSGTVPPWLEWSQGPCLLDCIEVKLMDVDVFTARRVPFKMSSGQKSFRIVREVRV